MSILESMIKSMGNEYASIADDGISAGDVSGWVDTGSYTLNALVSGSVFGGFPGNKVIAIASEPGVGKTYLAMSACLSFLNNNPNGYVLYFESESAITKNMLVERGIDTKRVAIIPVTTVQEFRTQVLKAIDNYEKMKEKDRPPMFMVLDSLGQLSTEKEMNDSLEGKDVSDMTRAKLVKGTFRTITLKLGRVNVPLLVTNHVYDDIGGGLYATKKMGGGSGITYASSLILTLTKAKEKDSLTNEVTGVIVSVTTAKSRLTKENQKVKILIKYDSGLDRYYGLLELAEAAGIFKKVSTRYELPDGSKLFGKAIMKDPQKYFNEKVLQEIDEYVVRTFKYGGGGSSLAGDEEEHSEESE
jgi:RecA/RadA recombinase